jgi:hypothetical protein
VHGEFHAAARQHIWLNCGERGERETSLFAQQS